MFEKMRKHAKRWFGSRMPLGERVTLSQRSTYIWPTKSGYFLIGIGFLMLIGATNYQNNLAFLLTFLLVGLGLVSIIMTFKNMQGIEFTLLPGKEVFAGDNLIVAVSLKSRFARKHSSIGIGGQKSNLKLVDVPEEGFNRVNCEFVTEKRGWLTIPRLMVTSVFPFGWLRTWAYFGYDKPILVYPSPIEPTRFNVNYSGQESEEGQRTEGNEDLYGLKPYQQGESLARVDWKSYARERGMFVKEFASYEGQDLSFGWDDFVGETAEHRLSYLTFLVLDAASQNLSYSLTLPNQFISLGEGELQRKKCLKSLAMYGLGEIPHSGEGK